MKIVPWKSDAVRAQDVPEKLCDGCWLDVEEHPCRKAPGDRESYEPLCMNQKVIVQMQERKLKEDVSMAKKVVDLGKGTPGEVRVYAPLVMMIKAGSLDFGPNVRGKIRPEKVDAFAENIRGQIKAGGGFAQTGIDDPLKVEREINLPDRYVIRDGACRFLGGVKAGVKEFPCLEIQPVKDVAVYQLRTTFREDFGAVEEAKAFRDQLKNKTLADLVLATGKEKTYIEKRMMLLSLDAEMQQAITDGKISAGHGYVLAQVGNPASRKKLFGDTCRSKQSISSLILDVRQCDTAWLKEAKFATAECKKCPFAGLDAPDMFTQGDADDVKGFCTKPECFNEKQIATLKEEAKAYSAKYPDTTVKLTSEPSYHWRDKFPELKSAQHLYAGNQEELGKAWKNNCLKCKSLLLILGTSGDQEHWCQNPKCLRNLLPKEKNSGNGEGESGSPDRAEGKANNRVHLTRNDFLRKEIVKNTTDLKDSGSLESSLIIAVWSLVKDINFCGGQVSDFIITQKLVPTTKLKETKRIGSGNYRSSDFLLEYLVKFNNQQLHAALAFFSAKVVEKNNPFNIPVLVEVAKVTGRSLADFRVTEDYLNSMTKDELVKLAGEFKLNMPKLEKKGELVKFILDAKPVKAPAEITKEDYRGEE